MTNHCKEKVLAEYREKGFSFAQLYEIRKGLDMHLNVKAYADLSNTPEQMRAIRKQIEKDAGWGNQFLTSHQLRKISENVLLNKFTITQ